jgi:hypothetical protein
MTVFAEEIQCRSIGVGESDGLDIVRDEAKFLTLEGNEAALAEFS